MSANRSFSTSMAQDPFESVVRVSGDLDMSVTDELWAAIANLLDDDSRLVLDIEDVTFMDSTGLNAIVRAHRACDRFTVRSPSAAVQRLFDVSGVGRLIAVEPKPIAPERSEPR